MITKDIIVNEYTPDVVDQLVEDVRAFGLGLCDERYGHDGFTIRMFDPDERPYGIAVDYSALDWLIERLPDDHALHYELERQLARRAGVLFENYHRFGGH